VKWLLLGGAWDSWFIVGYLNQSCIERGFKIYANFIACVLDGVLKKNGLLA
jgi:hypothetical protein